MANSGQNFLDLLFGGVDKGINQFRQQQGQQTDLALTIQQMLQRQKQGDQGQQNWREQFDYTKSRDTANRMEDAGQQYQNALQQGLVNRQNAERFAETKRTNDATIAWRNAMAGRAAGGGTASKPYDLQKRIDFYLTKVPRTKDVVSMVDGKPSMFPEKVERPLMERLREATVMAIKEHIGKVMKGTGQSGAPRVAPAGGEPVDSTSAMDEEIAALEAELGL